MVLVSASITADAKVSIHYLFNILNNKLYIWSVSGQNVIIYFYVMKCLFTCYPKCDVIKTQDIHVFLWKCKYSECNHNYTQQVEWQGGAHCLKWIYRILVKKRHGIYRILQTHTRLAGSCHILVYIGCHYCTTSTQTIIPVQAKCITVCPEPFICTHCLTNWWQSATLGCSDTLIGLTFHCPVRLHRARSLSCPAPLHGRS